MKDIYLFCGNRNLIDAANIAALAALLTFRRPECSLGGEDGQELIVHPPEVSSSFFFKIRFIVCPMEIIYLIFHICSTRALIVVYRNLKKERADKDHYRGCLHLCHVKCIIKFLYLVLFHLFVTFLTSDRCGSHFL